MIFLYLPTRFVIYRFCTLRLNLLLFTSVMCNGISPIVLFMPLSVVSSSLWGFDPLQLQNVNGVFAEFNQVSLAGMCVDYRCPARKWMKRVRSTTGNSKSSVIQL